MADEQTLSTLSVILDNAPMAVYVSAVDSHELLYTNIPARKRSEKLPYEPSVHCVPIDWNGTPAYIEYISDTDITLKEELTDTNEKMQNIINAIPGGVAIYKVSDIFETIYFSDGVPELSGYTAKEYQKMIKQDAAAMTYWEDTEMVIAKAREVIQTHEIATFEFRRQHRDGHIVWVRTQIKWIGEQDGYPLLHCVFHNISDFKEAQLEMNHLLNSIPGGIVSYRVENNRFIPTYFSDGVMTLSGHTRKEYEEMVKNDALDIIYRADRQRVLNATINALKTGDVLDISYRIRHKDGYLIWIHLNGRRMDPYSKTMRFYAVFTGISSETRLFQDIANETADGIYVIDQENYDLLYASESKQLFQANADFIGQKCYRALHGKDEPCEFCTLKTHGADNLEHEMKIPGSDRFFMTRFKKTDWKGIPSYIKFVQDVTDEVCTRKEKERLEQYFQTLVKNIPGGIAVVRFEKDGHLTPEFLSDGFAAMTGMTIDEAWELYAQDATVGVHPDDVDTLNAQISSYISDHKDSCELVYRLKKGDGSYLWVKNTLTMIQNENKFYCNFHDMTKERTQQKQLLKQYNDLILQHYRTPIPDALIVGHCNITQNKILEIIDYTNSNLLKRFGDNRETFFTEFSKLIVDAKEQQNFKDIFLNSPSLNSFHQDETELSLNCFLKLPSETLGRYVQFKVNLVKTPDTGDITGILTVADITEKTISDLFLHRLSRASYDLVIDVNLFQDRYTVFSDAKTPNKNLPFHGIHSKRISYIINHYVVPKDKKYAAKMLQKNYMFERLKKEGSYSFAFSITEKGGEIQTKNITVSSIDLRLGRVCLAETDITDSIREQQQLLNVIAYTFEMMAFINIETRQTILYNQKTVLNKLAPTVIENYNDSINRFCQFYDSPDGQKVIMDQFRIKNMLSQLEEHPSGYDFVLPHKSAKGLQYKQINVLWGSRDHKIICIVRADVTEILAAERRSKDALQEALSLAEKASLAKSDFLSSMSHDIRTPMNAIMGMTNLAYSYIDDKDRVKDCLDKISFSSQHLLSLINDILDMSKIERSKISLNRMRIYLPELLKQISAMIIPQSKAAGLQFDVKMIDIIHNYFYGDSLRINQILINILGNAIKFTPEGGKILFEIRELPPTADSEFIHYCFSVTDTGVGMSEEFLAQIFEPFTRNHNAVNVEGSGLGLSITKGLVDIMGGTISVKSQLHQGTTFYVELEFEPASDNDNSAFQRKPELSSHEKKTLLTDLTFLVAEDNAINSEILCELLKMYGAKTVVKTDGAQAVQEFNDSAFGTYDAILMDIQMPKMNGYEASRAIRSLDRQDAHTIPIIAMTANAFSEDIQASLDAGMNAHIAKPIDTQVLWETFKDIFGSTS